MNRYSVLADHPRTRSLVIGSAVAAVAAAMLEAGASNAGAAPAGQPDRAALGHFKHLVVIYEENHSFDNLLGGGGAGNGVEGAGLGRAGHGGHPPPGARTGRPPGWLPPNDGKPT